MRYFMKVSYGALLLLLIFNLMVTPGQAGQSPGQIVSVLLDGQQVEFDTFPFIDQNGRTLVPFRFIAEKLGASVSWNQLTKQVDMKNDTQSITLWAGQARAEVNGQVVTLDTRPVVVNGRTMVPLRFIAETFGLMVNWEAEKRLVSLWTTTGKAIGSGQTTTGGVRVRSGPGTNYGTICQLDSGVRLTLLKQEADWYQVRLADGRVGWIAGWLVAPVDLPEPEPSEPDVPLPPPVNKITEVLVEGAVVRVTGTVPLQYTVAQADPEKTAFDFQGFLLASNNLTVAVPEGVIAQVQVSQKTADTVRILVDFRSTASFTASLEDNGKVIAFTFTPDAPPDPPASSLKKITGLEVKDAVVTVTGDGPLYYTTQTLSNPDRIAIDFQEFTFDRPGNFLPATGMGPVIQVRTSQYTADTVRLVVDLRGQATFIANPQGSGETIAFAFTLQGDPTEKVVVLDPGHGGIGTWGVDPGAIGPGGLQEKDVNLDIAQKVGEILKQQGIQVVYTRQEPNNLTYWERAHIATTTGASAYVSIHANASLSRTARGTSTYFYAPPASELANQRAARERLAGYIQEELVRQIQLRDLGLMESNLAVLRYTVVPSALVEVAFLSNPTEEALLASADFRTRAAEGIAAGILRFLADAL